MKFIAGFITGTFVGTFALMGYAFWSVLGDEDITP